MQKVFWTQGAKVSEKVFCTTQTPFCTGAKAVLGGAKNFSETFAPWVQRPFAPSPKHFWEFSLFGQFPRPVASNSKPLRVLCDVALNFPCWLPKGPSRTKNTTDCKFTIRSKFATAIVKHYRARFYTPFGERTLVPVFVPGEHPPKQPFWKPTFCEPPIGGSLRRVEWQGPGSLRDMPPASFLSCPKRAWHTRRQTPVITPFNYHAHQVISTSRVRHSREGASLNCLAHRNCSDFCDCDAIRALATSETR